MKKFTASIIGAGSIGALKDDKYDSPTTEEVLTHAHACYSHPQIELIDIIDTDPSKARAAAHKWNCSYESEIPSNLSIDIMFVCTPTSTHLEVIKQITELKHKPSVIVAEKPFCSDYKEAVEAAELCDKNGIKILVNYIRNFTDTIDDVMNEIKEGKYGEIYSALCHYVRGFQHEGCHAISMFSKMFEEFYGGVHLPNTKQPLQTTFMKFYKCENVIMIEQPWDNYNIFDIEIRTEKGKIVFADRGQNILIHPVAKEPIYGDYNTLQSLASEELYTDLTRALLMVADNALDVVKSKNAHIFCSAEDAIEVHQIIRSIQ